MKVNRRSLFGLFGAAVVASQDSMSKGIDVVANKPSATILGKDVPMPDDEYQAKALEQARRIARGEFDPDEKVNMVTSFYTPYEPLKSMSQAGRFFCQNRKAQKACELDLIERAKKELRRYDKFGFCNMLFTHKDDV